MTDILNKVRWWGPENRVLQAEAGPQPAADGGREPLAPFPEPRQKNFSVKVTAEELRDGVPGHRCKCAVAQALPKSIKGAYRTFVTDDSIAFNLPFPGYETIKSRDEAPPGTVVGIRFWYRAPGRAAESVRHFDRDKSGSPFKFKLHQSDCYLSYDIKQVRRPGRKDVRKHAGQGQAEDGAARPDASEVRPTNDREIDLAIANGSPSVALAACIHACGGQLIAEIRENPQAGRDFLALVTSAVLAAGLNNGETE
jgi:hypothetical protein